VGRHERAGRRAQATATRAAGTATQRHVCTGVSIVVSGGPVAPAAQTLTFNLRDGATGAGAVLASWTIGVEAVAGKSVPINLSGLEIAGSYATAMTLEGSAAPGANTLESVVLAGFTGL
jgi:hypothetical protein